MITNNHGIREFDKIKTLARPHWNKLAKQQQIQFNERSQNELKIEFKRKKMTFNGLEFDDYIEESLERKKILKFVIPEIEEIAKNSSALDQVVFHVISTSYFDDYPAEIAMVKFSLKDGIKDFINILMKPGKLSKIIRKNDEIDENLEIPEEQETDYFTIIEEILNFLHPLETIPIFFSDEDIKEGFRTLKQSHNILSFLLHQVQENASISSIRIYPVQELFNILKIYTCDNRVPDSKLYKNVHLTPGCDQHNSQGESYNCCLSKARQICYTIFKWCCDESIHELKPELHYPIKTED
jgi:hypothetical protein